MPFTVILGLLLATAPASELQIHWQGEPACVDTSTLDSRMSALLATPRSAGASVGLSASRAGDGWRISLEARDAQRQIHRVLRGRDCRTLTEAVALIVAVQLDPVRTAATAWPEPISVVRSTPPSAPAPSPSVPAPSPAAPVPGTTTSPGSSTGSSTGSSPSPEPSATASVEPSPGPRPRAVRLLLSATASGEVGVLPRGAAAFEVGVGAAWPHARVELGGLTSVGPDTIADELPSVGGRFRLFTGLIRACGVMARNRVELPLCAGVELGDLRALGTGLEQPATVDALWVALTGGARPRWVATPRLAVGGALDLVAPLRRHRFATAEAGPVHEVAPIGARLGLHLELRLP